MNMYQSPKSLFYDIKMTKIDFEKKLVSHVIRELLEKILPAWYQLQLSFVLKINRVVL